MLAAGDDQSLDLARHPGDRGFEVRDTGQRLDLGLVGEQNVDLPAVDELVEAVAVAVDAERV